MRLKIIFNTSICFSFTPCSIHLLSPSLSPYGAPIIHPSHNHIIPLIPSFLSYSSSISLLYLSISTMSCHSHIGAKASQLNSKFCLCRLTHLGTSIHDLYKLHKLKKQAITLQLIFKIHVNVL